MINRFLAGLFVTLLLLINFVPKTYAQDTSPSEEKSFEAVVTKIVEQKQVEVMEHSQLYQKIELKVTNGSRKDQTISIENGTQPMVNQIIYKVGDKVSVLPQKDPEGNEVYLITDFVRRDPLIYLGLIFVVLAVAVGRKSGFKAILGMIISFLVIFSVILPQIAGGADPITVTVLAAFIIVPVTFYLAHGLNKKTSVAIAGTFISLVVIAILAQLFVAVTKLTGYASEEAGFLQAAAAGTVNVKGLLLAGIVVGALGILDDITVSQAAIVQELKDTDPSLKFWPLYKRAMHVGQDHIASAINTLLLVYTGAALPLLLLFVNNPHPVSEVINYEVVAEEIVRTLVGSIGLILAVPLTTLLACYVFTKKQTAS